MTHQNRGRLTINPNGNWRIYTNPNGNFTMLGTVTREDTDTGALALAATGIYVQINAGAIRNLDQRKIKAALGISNNAGAPKQMESGKRRNVYIDDVSWALAQKLGNGNASEGIRLALEKS